MAEEAFAWKFILDVFPDFYTKIVNVFTDEMIGQMLDLFREFDETSEREHSEKPDQLEPDSDAQKTQNYIDDPTKIKSAFRFQDIYYGTVVKPS